MLFERHAAWSLSLRAHRSNRMLAASAGVYAEGHWIASLLAMTRGEFWLGQVNRYPFSLDTSQETHVNCEQHAEEKAREVETNGRNRIQSCYRGGRAG